jgi:23S rRNA (cytosine1962-C5)-methyltransferase
MKAQKKTTTAPVARVIVNAHAIARLRGGHPWIFRSDIERLNQAAPGGLVRVEDQRGKVWGSALYSSASQIALRMVALNAVDAEKYPDLLRYRIRQAIAYRERMVRDSDAFRVLFSEADITPGLIVDKYNDVISVQVWISAKTTRPPRDMRTDGHWKFAPTRAALRST